MVPGCYKRRLLFITVTNQEIVLGGNCRVIRLAGYIREKAGQSS